MRYNVNLVETTGVEPVVPFGRRIYSPLGLPIFLHLQNTTESAFVSLTVKFFLIAEWILKFGSSGQFRDVDLSLIKRVLCP